MATIGQRLHTWTLEEERYLITRDAEGASSQQIADELGLGKKQVIMRRYRIKHNRERYALAKGTTMRDWLNENMLWRPR